MTETALVTRTTVRELVAWRDQALAAMEDAARMMGLAYVRAKEAQECAGRAHGGARFYQVDRREQESYRRLFAEIDQPASLEAYRRQVDASCWVNLMGLTKMADLMDRKAREDFDKDLAGDVPPFTEQNAWSTFERLAGDAPLIWRRGLARTFANLDRRFRSHDGFKIGARVVLTYVFDAWGAIHYSSKVPDEIVDIERAFAILDGEKPAGTSIIALLNQSRRSLSGPRQSETESTYFRIRGFKNGNAHLWFTRDDLVEKVNQELAAYYGQVLADAVPRAAGASPQDFARDTALCKDLSFYATPAAVVEIMLGRVYLKAGARVLEPSAGTGHIAHELRRRGARVDAVEVDVNRAHQIRGCNVRVANFLNLPPDPVYDLVVMNPPFYGVHWMDHVVHAHRFLKPGGTLISVLPVTAEIGESAKHDAFRAWLDGKRPRWQDLPPESFASSGTRINTVTLELCA